MNYIYPFENENPITSSGIDFGDYGTPYENGWKYPEPYGTTSNDFFVQVVKL